MDKFLPLILRMNYQGVPSPKQSLSQEDFKKFSELFSMLGLLCKPSEKEINKDLVLWELASKCVMKEILKLSYEYQKEFLVFLKEQMRHVNHDESNIFKDKPIYDFLSGYLKQVRWGSPEELAALKAMEKVIRINDFDNMSSIIADTFDYLLKSCSLFPNDHPERVPLRVAYIIVCYFSCSLNYPRMSEIDNKSYLMLIQSIKRSLCDTATKKHLFASACYIINIFFSSRSMDHFTIPSGTSETHLFFNTFAPVVKDNLKHIHGMLRYANVNELFAIFLPLSIRGNPQDKNYSHPLLSPEQSKYVPFNTKVWGPQSISPSPESKKGYHPTYLRVSDIFCLIETLLKVGTNSEFESWLGNSGLNLISSVIEDFIRGAKLVSESSEYADLAREQTLIQMSFEANKIVSAIGTLAYNSDVFNSYFCSYFRDILSALLEVLYYPHFLSIIDPSNELIDIDDKNYAFRRSRPFLINQYLRDRTWGCIFDLFQKRYTSDINMDVLLEVGLCKAFVCAVAGEFAIVKEKKKNKEDSGKEKKRHKKRRYFMMEIDNESVKYAIRSFVLVLYRYNREYNSLKRRTLGKKLLGRTMDKLYEEDIVSAILLWKYTFRFNKPTIMPGNLIYDNNSDHIVGMFLRQLNIPSNIFH